MTNKEERKLSYYSMSEVGTCPRALSAKRLGYAPIPETPENQEALLYYTRCEALAAAQITDAGYVIEPSSLCLKCKTDLGIERYGIHVQIEETLFTLIGHLDRRIVVNDIRYPVEIKSLGKWSWTRFAKEQFSQFSEYAAQECCYLQAEQKPGIYWVMNRDTGKPLKYAVNDTENKLADVGFTRLELPVQYADIIDQLNSVEIAVASKELLPAVDCGYSYNWCKYRFLCPRPEEKSEELHLPELAETAAMYRKGHEMEKEGEELKDLAVHTLLTHAKQNSIDKFRVGGISFSYSGMKTRDTMDIKKLRELDPKLAEIVVRQSKPYDSYSIRILKED